MPKNQDTDPRASMYASARAAGLRHVATPSLEAVERRRMQLWLLLFAVLIGLSAALVLISFWTETLPVEFQDVTSLHVLRVLFLAVIVAFCVYVIEKERHLRRLTHILIDERVLNSALTNRVTELANLAQVGKAVNSELDPDRVLELILTAALDMLQASEGAIMLVDNERRVLRAVTTRSPELVSADVAPEIMLGEGVPGWVAQSREPLLVSREHSPDLFSRLVAPDSGIHAAMSVPLIHRSELLGVLAVTETAGAREFNEYDLRTLGLFAENAAVAISNARRLDTERAHVAKLQELDRQRSEFVATVSHELRSPLTSVVGAVRTLQKQGRDLPPELFDECLRVIARQSERLMHLISDILLASRIEAGQNRLRQDEVSISEVVGDVLDGLHARDPLRRVQLSSSPPRVLVVGDAGAIGQILTNLLDNGLKYAPGDTPVTLSVVESGNEVVLTVSDAGPGIPQKELGHIFERFHQAAAAGGTPSSGVGLGLYITANLVSGLGGRIWVQSEEGRGAAFSFTLPILRREEPAISSERYA